MRRTGPRGPVAVSPVAVTVGLALRRSPPRRAPGMASYRWFPYVSMAAIEELADVRVTSWRVASAVIHRDINV
jgi:hypothetical protein